MSEFKKLIDSWQELQIEDGLILEKGLDLKTIKEINANKNKKEYKFDFSFVPQPWWGNIKDPKIIILLINPGIIAKEWGDKKENKDLHYKLLDNLKGENTLDWFSEKEEYESRKWWYRTFEKLIGDGVNLIDIHKKVGVFQLYGYHSEKFYTSNDSLENINRKRMGYYGILNTQEAMFNYLNKMLTDRYDQDNEPLIIIIRGQKYWRKHVKKLDAYDYIDTILPVNQELSEGNLRSIDYNRIIERLK